MHPVLFYIPTPSGAIPVFSYGVMLGASLLVGWYIVMRLANRDSPAALDAERVANVFTIAVLCAVVGARCLYVAFHTEEFANGWQWFDLRHAGLSPTGAALGALLGSWIYLRRKGIALLAWTDTATPALGAGLAISSIGAYLHGSSFGVLLPDGAPTWLRNLGTFPKWDFSDAPALASDVALRGAPAFIHHQDVYFERMTDAVTSLGVHPTQLYACVAGIVLFIVSSIWLKRRRFVGQVSLALGALFATWRFMLDGLLADPSRADLFGFSGAQVVSLFAVPICLLGYVSQRKRAIVTSHSDPR